MTTNQSDDEGLREEIHRLFFDQSLQYPVDSSDVRYSTDAAMALISQKIIEAEQRVQKCPVCNGTGKRDNYIDSPDCRCCKGAMILTKQRITTLTQGIKE